MWLTLSLHFVELPKSQTENWGNGSTFPACAHWKFSLSADLVRSRKMCQENRALILHISCLFGVSHILSGDSVLAHIGQGQVRPFFPNRVPQCLLGWALSPGCPDPRAGPAHCRLGLLVGSPPQAWASQALDRSGSALGCSEDNLGRA